MGMRTLWRNRAVLLRWSAFVFVLAGVAAALYWILPPEPRWERVLEPSTVIDAGDDRIAVFRPTEDAATGPVQFLDAVTGAEVGRFLTDGDTMMARGQSADGRYFVALVKGSRPFTWRICGIDLLKQCEWRVDAPAGAFQSAVFSPRCDFAALQLRAPKDAADAYAIVDTLTGRIVAQAQLARGATAVSFADDGGCVALSYDDGKGVGHIHAVDTRTGKTALFDDGRVVAIAPDSRCLIADRGGRGVWVGDVATGAWRCPLEDADNRGFGVNRHGLAFVDVDSDGFIVSLRRRGRVGDLITTVRSWRGRLRRSGVWRTAGTAGLNPQFSPDGRFALWHAGPDWGLPNHTLYDVQTGKPLWQRTLASGPDGSLFTPDSRRIVLGLSDANSVEVVSAATGATVQTIALPGLIDLEPRLTRDERTLIVAASPEDHEPHWLWAKILAWLPERPETEPMLLRAFDLESGTALGELWIEDTDEFWLTSGRRSLITVCHEYDDRSQVTATIIRGWDMPPQKPLRWVAGGMLVAALVMLLLRFGWRRLRRRPVTDPAPQAAARPGTALS